MIKRIKQRRKRRLIRRVNRQTMNARLIWHFLHDPSEREIGRALGIAPSSVHDAIVRLRDANLNRGAWTL